MVCHDKEHNHNNEGKGECSTSVKHKCCAFRCVLAILVFALIGWGSGMAIWGGFESAWKTEELAHMWRPMDAEHWKWMPVAYLIQAAIFVCLYKCLGSALSCCKCPFMRGAKFGAKIWLFAGFSCSLFWFITENVTLEVVAVHLVHSLIAFVIGGALASKILGNIWCEEEGECETTKGDCSSIKGDCGSTTHGKNHCGG